MADPAANADITALIARLKAGDESAAQPLWQHYFGPLTRFAARRLSGTPARAADEEDVALSVLKSFFAGAPQGRFTQLANREDLWTLLLRMTRRKVVDLWRQEHRQRRGAGRVRGNSVFDGDQASAGLDGFAGPDALPHVFAVLEELLEELRDETLRTVVVLRLEGHRTTEIAALLGTTRRTVERKLALVREQWTLGEETDD